jgi:membrane fusion protein, multidrug efflux system
MATQEVLTRIPEPGLRGPKKQHHRWIPWLLAVIFAVVAVLAWRAAERRQKQEQAMQAAAARRAALRPVPVAVAQARQGNLPIYLEGLGTVTPSNTDNIAPRVAGQIMKYYVQQGQDVAVGQPLALIDPRPYQAQLGQAQGQLNHDQAQLHDDDLDLARDKALAGDGIITQQQLDAQEALVDQLQGSVVSDKAQIANAQLNLSYCRLTAPIPGKVGLWNVDLGNYVQAGTSLLVITQMHPIYVIFTLPEQEITPILRGLRQGQNFPVTAYDRGDTHQIASGSLLATDNQINQTTGTLRLEARFSNRDEVLFPNEFVNIHIETEVLRHALLMPAAALQHGPQGDFVFMVMPNKTVAEQPVKISTTQGDSMVVQSGLNPGDTVVTDGQDKLHVGSHVIAESAPNPQSPSKGGEAL